MPCIWVPPLAVLPTVGWLVCRWMGGSEESRRQVRWSKTPLLCSALTFRFWFGVLIGRRRDFNLGWGNVSPNLCSVARPQAQHFHPVSLCSLPSETAMHGCSVTGVVGFLFPLCLHFLLRWECLISCRGQSLKRKRQKLVKQNSECFLNYLGGRSLYQGLL